MLSNNNKIKLNEIRLSCSAHSTEDLEKVKEAMLNLLPEKLRNSKEIQIVEITGHSGNIFHLLEMSMKQKQKITQTIEYIAEEMDEMDKIFLYEDLETYLGEDNNLYLRFNKQDAYYGSLSFDEKDNTIKVVIKFVVYKQEPHLVEDMLETLKLIKKE